MVNHDFIEINTCITNFTPKSTEQHRLEKTFPYSARCQATVARFVQVYTLWWSERKTLDVSFHFWNILQIGNQMFSNYTRPPYSAYRRPKGDSTPDFKETFIGIRSGFENSNYRKPQYNRIKGMSSLTNYLVQNAFKKI